MSTYTGIMVAGTEVESYRNHHSIWATVSGKTAGVMSTEISQKIRSSDTGQLRHRSAEE
jgi:hypothetical protein